MKNEVKQAYRTILDDLMSHWPCPDDCEFRKELDTGLNAECEDPVLKHRSALTHLECMAAIITEPDMEEEGDNRDRWARKIGYVITSCWEKGERNRLSDGEKRFMKALAEGMLKWTEGRELPPRLEVVVDRLK